MNPKILFDLSLAHNLRGYAGIPQETRYLFIGLLSSPRVNVSGLIWPHAMWMGDKLDSTEKQSLFLGLHIGGHYNAESFWMSFMNNRKYLRLVSKLIRIRRSLRKDYGIFPLFDGFGEMVWRSFFSNVRPDSPEERQTARDADYRLSDLSLETLNRIVGIGLSPPFIDTRGYDLVVFQDAKPIRVSTNTKKIIRYHDAIPVFASDTVLNPAYTRIHYRSVLECSRQNCTFVCNSPVSVEDLGRISESAAKRAKVIPPLVPKFVRRYVEYDFIKGVLINRLSKKSYDANILSSKEYNAVSIVNRWFRKSNKIPPFIMAVATLEPKKNLERLVSAWRIVRSKLNVNLLIVGGRGWAYEKIHKAIRDHIKSGELLHIEGVSQYELECLYSSAACLVFPSLVEGFGMPPIEAMQCGCPVVVSDIPAHRYSAGDAALYCDPYNEEDIAAKIERILDINNINEVHDLVNRGYQNAKRFSRENLTTKWEEVFIETIERKDR